MFVDDGGPLDRFGGGEQLLVVVDLDAPGVESLGDLPFAVVHDHEMPQPFERGHQRCEQPEQRLVGEDHLVIGVVDDVGQLLGEQPDVERVEDTTGTRRREVQLEVACGVPGERCHPAVVGDAERVEDAAQPPGALGPLRIGGPFESRPRRRHDLLVAEVLLGPIEQVRDRERNVLHQPLHER